MKRDKIRRSCLILCSLLALAIQTKTKDIPVGNGIVAVTMNGHPVNYDALPMYSRGVLAIVAGDPQSSRHKPMLFQATLCRSGKAVQQWSGKNVEGIYAIQLDEIWPFVQLGDELVVEPVYTAGEIHKPGKRVFKLGIINLFTWNKC